MGKLFSDDILGVDEKTFGTTPIPVQEVWQVLDSSKIQKFMGCPRDFFYSHVLGWQKEEPNIHMSFGSGLHSAMEILKCDGYDPDTVLKAYNEFVDVYTTKMGRGLDYLNELHDNKNPGTALRALAEYTKKYMNEDRPEDVMFIESAGTAPLPEGRLIHAKLDTIRRFPPHHSFHGMIHSLEHKTTGRRSRAWEDKWTYLFQIGTYNHFLKCAFDPDNVFGVVVNGIVFNRNKRQFVRIPVQFSNEMWELWVNEAMHWIDQIVWNMQMLYETKESDRVMVAFPRNSASCSKFGCNHPELCTVHANPLRRCHQPPLGYKVDFWDPRRNEEEANYKFTPAGDKKVDIVKNEDQKPKTKGDDPDWEA